MLSPLSASVNFRMKLPSLLLEDIEHMVDEVHCEADSIELSFSSSDHMNIVRNALSLHREFIVITSHATCNDEHSRLPYLYGLHQLSWHLRLNSAYHSRIDSLFYSMKSNRITLSSKRLTWKDSMTTMTTNFDRLASYGLRTQQHYARQRVVSMPVKRGISESLFGTATISSIPISITSTISTRLVAART